MFYQKLTLAFNKSLSFSKKRLFVANSSLLVCLAFFLFFISLNPSHLWLQTAFYYLPIFCSGIVLYCSGILIQTLYKNEKQLQKISGKRVWIEATRKIALGLYVPILPLMIFCFLWILLGIFSLLHAVPFVGVLLSFLIVSTLLAISLTLALQLLFLFFVTPSKDKRGVINKAYQRIGKDVLGNLLAFFIAILPFVFLYFLSYFSFRFFPEVSNITALEEGLYYLFMALPVSFLGSFGVVLFFQFSWEVNNQK